MSNLSETLIERLQLQRLLCERVFVKWKDQSGTPFTLGSRLNTNKQNLKFLIAAYYDIGHIHIHFSLKVSITLHGNKHEIEILLVVPPNADFANASKPCLLSNINDLSCFDASAIHDAEISDTLHVIRIQFDLIAEGFVVMKKKTATTIKSWNKTSKNLIRSLESLSNTKTFTVYIKPNDYAQVGLRGLCNRLSNTCTATDTHITNMKEMYIQQGVVLVDWSRFDPVLLPPPYIENPPQVFPEVQVPRSPPIIFERETPSTNSIEAAIEETPARSPISPNSISVHGIFSSCEESSDSEVNLDNIEKDIGLDLDVDSDEEQLAKEQFASLNSRELNQQLDHGLEVSQILNSKLVKWMETALRINLNVHEHKRLTTKLSTLGNCVRTSNTSLFDATLLWCSALFFYDPLDSDSDNTLGLWEERNLWLISDIATLIPWADKMRSGAEISSSVLEHFIKLGDAARIVALDPRCNKGVYLQQKSIFIAYILAEFGKLGSISKENSEPVSRKTLGTDSNARKRVKM